jgi:hypothetical protein
VTHRARTAIRDGAAADRRQNVFEPDLGLRPVDRLDGASTRAASEQPSLAGHRFIVQRLGRDTI